MGLDIIAGLLSLITFFGGLHELKDGDLKYPHLFRIHQQERQQHREERRENIINNISTYRKEHKSHFAVERTLRKDS